MLLSLSLLLVYIFTISSLISLVNSFRNDIQLFVLLILILELFVFYISALFLFQVIFRFRGKSFLILLELVFVLMVVVELIWQVCFITIGSPWLFVAWMVLCQSFLLLLFNSIDWNVLQIFSTVKILSKIFIRVLKVSLLKSILKCDMSFICFMKKILFLFYHLWVFVSQISYFSFASQLSIF